MRTLLIVEDERVIRQGIRAMVERMPLSVEKILEAKNGKEAVDILESEPVDVVITDIHMPELDGIELAGRASRLSPAPHIIVISGYDDFSYAVEMLRAGVRDYLLKPVDRGKLAAVLARVDEELRADDRRRESSLAAGRRLFRVLMEGGALKPSEAQAIDEQYGAMLPESYVAICAPGGDCPAPPGDALMFENVGGHCVLLCDAARLPTVADGLSCAGVSGAHEGSGSLRTAFREAAAARAQAFMRSATTVYPPAAQAHVPPAPVNVHKIADMLAALNIAGCKLALGEVVLHAQNGRMSPAAFERAMHEFLRDVFAASRAAADIDEDEWLNIWRHRNVFDFYLALCSLLDDLHARLREAFENENRSKILRAVQFIQENYLRDLDMAQVSRHIGMNYTQFSLLFKQHTGSNFLEYLRNLRLSEGKQLLCDTDLRIGEVGRRCGFKNDKHFMKTFKAAFGISPGEYRRVSRMRQAPPP